ncbi:MAG: type VI secretion system baseplate subunit TssG [Planctomycetaceae bacterium]|nr:type VI secretion system baseplate subunit TssG [Planctomycetaceae bacterium]
MASTSGRKSTPVNRRLEEEPYRFDFFQAVRLLEQVPGGEDPAEPARKSVGREHAPRDEAVRFRALPSHTFPPSEIVSLEFNSDTVDPGPAVPEMVVSFMGMTGPSGVLPQHYTQLVIDRLRFKDHALRDMLDVFNHRAISLFYRAWRKYRFSVEFEREAKEGREDLFTSCLYSLVGYGTPHLRQRQEVPDGAFLNYAGHFAHSPRSAISLELVLSDYFGLDVEIVQFVGQWLHLDEADQSRAPAAGEYEGCNNLLGADVVVGERVWSVENKFRVQLGSLNYAGFKRFSPDGDGLVGLCQLVRSYAGPDYDFDVQPILKAEDVPPLQLAGDGEPACNLGWNTWLSGAPFTEDATDAVFFHEGGPTR